MHRIMISPAFILLLLLAAFSVHISESKTLKYVTREEPYKSNFGFDTRDLTCLECKTTVETAQTMMAQGAPDEEILDVATAGCIRLDIAEAEVCAQMVELSGYEVLYVLNNTVLDTTTICGFLLGGGHCKTDSLPSWDVTIPGGKPPPSHPEPAEPADPIRIMHISDVHVDLEYVTGTPDECDQPLCCRDWGSNTTHPSAEPAGYWGSGASCDVPLRTLDALLENAVLQMPDIIYVSGDLPAHDVWIQNHTSILYSIDVITDRIKNYFPNIPTVMCMGNHESAPVNSFPFPAVYSSGYTMTWLYNHLANIWRDWIPYEALDKLIEGGFYDYSPFQGLRVVSINMNFCNNQNWWLLLYNEDPVQELNWLIETLLIAEAFGEKVHIIGHISASSCEDSWSRVYNQIVSRFESTITGQFFGHSHRDAWDIFWSDEDNTIPTSVSYISGSITGEGKKNPTFKIFTADPDTWSLLNYESWLMNMTESNEMGEFVAPDFYMAYDAKSAYDLSGMSPQSWADSTYAMATDDDLFNSFMSSYHNWYAYPDEIDTCTPNSDCRSSALCGLVVTDATNSEPCDRIKLLVNGETNVTLFV